MSWSHSIVVEIEKGIEAVEADIRNIVHPTDAQEHLAAAKEAAVALAKTVTVPPGATLSVSVSGHASTPGTPSIGDSVNASVQVVAKPTA
jgi:hypothetical protein